MRRRNEVITSVEEAAKVKNHFLNASVLSGIPDTSLKAVSSSGDGAGEKVSDALIPELVKVPEMGVPETGGGGDRQGDRGAPRAYPVEAGVVGTLSDLLKGFSGLLPKSKPEYKVPTFEWTCFDQENKKVGTVVIEKDKEWDVVQEKISKMINKPSGLSYLNTKTNEVVIVETQAGWIECCDFVIAEELDKRLEIVIIPLTNLRHKVPFLDAGEPPIAPPRSDIRVPTPDPTPPPTPPTRSLPTPERDDPPPEEPQRAPSPAKEPTLQEEFPHPNLGGGEFGDFFDTLSQMEERKIFTMQEYELAVDAVTAGDADCERAYLRYKRTGDMRKLRGDLLATSAVRGW